MTSAEARAVKGRISAYESCGTVDGPGLRFVVFFQGCPLRCLYCHNPETWEFDGGDELTAGELFDEICKYKNFMHASQGGVTFSGGDPLSQPVFLEALLSLCREEGIHTVIDTSGFAPLNQTIKRCIDQTDLFLIDIKSINASMHQILTGESNKQPIAFAEYLAQAGVPVIMRYVLVPSLNDRERCLHKLGLWARGLGNIESIEVLPFHKMGEWKWKEYALPYRLSETEEPSETALTEIVELLRTYGLVVD